MWIHSKWSNLPTFFLDGAHNRALVPKMIFAKIQDQAIYSSDGALAKQSRAANKPKECKMGCHWLNFTDT
jgi:hypothetical protein